MKRVHVNNATLLISNIVPLFVCFTSEFGFLFDHYKLDGLKDG